MWTSRFTRPVLASSPCCQTSIPTWLSRCEAWRNISWFFSTLGWYHQPFYSNSNWKCGHHHWTTSLSLSVQQSANYLGSDPTPTLHPLPPLSSTALALVQALSISPELLQPAFWLWSGPVSRGTPSTVFLELSLKCNSSRVTPLQKMLNGALWLFEEGSQGLSWFGSSCSLQAHTSFRSLPTLSLLNRTLLSFFCVEYL